MLRPALAGLILAAALICTGLPPPLRAADPPADAESTDRMRLDSEAFLEIARRPPMTDSWARMTGTVTHYADRKRSQFPIDLRILMSPAKIMGQIQLDGGQRFAVSQVFADRREGTTVLTQREPAAGQARLQDLGLRPTDLTLSFLYWDYVKELQPESYKTKQCRIYRLRHPETGETAQVWIVVDALFPARVEWTLQDAQEPYRKLEFTDFVKRHGIWVVNGLRLRNVGSNANWKSDVQFDTIDVQPIDAEHPAPADLWLQD